MKKKLLMTAMLAAFGVSTAQAVHVNPDGLGQVLLYPYYTVQNGFVTSIHVVNTTSRVKVVKVRFLEGKNSREVLDFNLYLSPEDVWTGVVVGDETGAARITTNDTSCITSRAIPEGGEPFRNFEYLTDAAAFQSVDRTREGYVELIEMGELDPAVAPGSWAVHAAGVGGEPADCGALRTADRAGSTVISDAIEIPTGGLFGSGHLIAVNSGIRTSYDAVALDDFSETALYTTPGSLAPSLASVNTAANVIDGANLWTGLIEEAGRSAVDRVSAVLTKSAINNEYVIDAGRDSRTDWVVTFPTKRFYVNDAVPLEHPRPFTNAWSATTAQSCDEVSFDYFDREEEGRTPSEEDFSPAPPEGSPFQLCNEVNTLTLYRDGSDMSEAQLFGAEWTDAELAIENGFEAGWMRMGFNGANMYIDMEDIDTNVVRFNGLPVVGFAAMSSVNSVSVEIEGLTVYSAYMGSVIHKNETQIESD